MRTGNEKLQTALLLGLALQGKGNFLFYFFSIPWSSITIVGGWGRWGYTVAHCQIRC